MKGKFGLKICLLLLLLLPLQPFSAQENSGGELTETEKQKLMEEKHQKTGIVFYVQYPLPTFIPGWKFNTRVFEYGPAKLTMPGINFSYINVCLGLDMDFSSTKRILKNMGYGGALEWNVLDSFNMDDERATIFQTYGYIYYFEETSRFMDYYLKAGMGIATISNSELFESQEEKNSLSGPMILMELASAYPPAGNFLVTNFSIINSPCLDLLNGWIILKNLRIINGPFI